MKSKALLLLFIFLLNTLTGLACALRMSAHDQQETVAHHHDGGEAVQPHHHEKGTPAHHHDEPNVAKHPAEHLPTANSTSIAQNDPCCQAAVNNFNAVAKITPSSSQVVLLAPFTLIEGYHQFFVRPGVDVDVKHLAPLDERRRPPTHPIRIIIQSFQI